MEEIKYRTGLGQVKISKKFLGQTGFRFLMMSHSVGKGKMDDVTRKGHDLRFLTFRSRLTT